MVNVTGVRFKDVGKIYYFAPGDFELKKTDSVIVETARGIEYGTVVIAPIDMEEEKIILPLKEVIRRATQEDEEKLISNQKKEKEAYKICYAKIKKHNINMKLVDVEYTFDKSKILFYFTAEGRVDFRELVKDLASVFKTRIELRQIGIRDEAKMLGGIGICGRQLCCNTFLDEFQPVSIKMVKEQSLSLNPTKISGICSRLMCCLRYEHEAYKDLLAKTPRVGAHVKTPEGRGEIVATSLLKEKIKVKLLKKDDVELKEYNLTEVEVIERTKKPVIKNNFKDKKENK